MKKIVFCSKDNAPESAVHPQIICVENIELNATLQTVKYAPTGRAYERVVNRQIVSGPGMYWGPRR